MQPDSGDVAPLDPTDSSDYSSMFSELEQEKEDLFTFDLNFNVNDFRVVSF